MEGTKWVAPNEGSTLHEIRKAFGRVPEKLVYRFQRPFGMGDNMRSKTNLLLTGAPLTDYDWTRLESDAFKIGE